MDYIFRKGDRVGIAAAMLARLPDGIGPLGTVNREATACHCAVVIVRIDGDKTGNGRSRYRWVDKVHVNPVDAT